MISNINSMKYLAYSLAAGIFFFLSVYSLTRIIVKIAAIFKKTKRKCCATFNKN